MRFYTTNKEIDAYINDRIESLPAPLREAIENDELFTQLATFTQQREIPEADLEAMQHELFLVLLQLTPSNEFGIEIAARTDIDADSLIEVTQFVTNNLLVPYQQYLRNLPDEEAEDDLPREQIQFRPEETEKPSSDQADPDLPVASLATSRTMQRDIDIAKQQGESAETPETEAAAKDKEDDPGQIPRYAKPLTDTPRYSEDE